MFGLSIGEMIVILFIALILFGTENFPQHLKKGIHSFRKAKEFFKKTQSSLDEIKQDIVDSLEQSPPQNTISAQKPIQPIVSQEEIDEFQKKQEKE